MVRPAPPTDTRRFHIAISTDCIDESIRDYSKRLGAEPCAMVAGEYALWRTETLNVSIRQDPQCPPGQVRHLGWEDAEAESFSEDTDVNGITWERFTAHDQAAEIKAVWSQSQYEPSA